MNSNFNNFQRTNQGSNATSKNKKVEARLEEELLLFREQLASQLEKVDQATERKLSFLDKSVEKRLNDFENVANEQYDILNEQTKIMFAQMQANLQEVASKIKKNHRHLKELEKPKSNTILADNPLAPHSLIGSPNKNSNETSNESKNKPQEEEEKKEVEHKGKESPRLRQLIKKLQLEFADFEHKVFKIQNEYQKSLNKEWKLFTEQNSRDWTRQYDFNTWVRLELEALKKGR